MKKILVTCSSLVLFMTGIVFAECPTGNKAITIVNPAGKVIEICVPEAAVPGLQTGSDNSGTIIPAICPCFTQEDIEIEFAADPTFTCYPIVDGTTTYGNPCYMIRCYNTDMEIFYETTTATISYELDKCTWSNRLGLSINSTQCFGNIYGGEDTTKEEADACFEILRTFL